MRLDPTGEAPLALPDDAALRADLTAARYSVRLGRIVIEGKEEVRKRLGRSTDSADAVMLALYPIEPAGPFRFRPLVVKEPED
jgi:hypothetical protein